MSLFRYLPSEVFELIDIVSVAIKPAISGGEFTNHTKVLTTGQGGKYKTDINSTVMLVKHESVSLAIFTI